MKLLRLSIRNIWAKPLSSSLSTVLFAFGVSIIVLILLVNDHLKSQISKNAESVDLVIGAKGSPMQLILCNIFHVDFPTGNIALKEVAQITRNRLISSAIPLSLGDSYKGYRIVGSTPAYLDLYDGQMAQGSWESGSMTAVVGADVAKYLALEIGSQFASSHGLSEVGAEHGDHPFTVTGIMERSGTVLDGLILTSLRSVWEVHGHEEHTGDSLIAIPHLGIQVTSHEYEKEITAVLVGYSSPMGAVRLPMLINQGSSFQAASPAFETARLFNLIGTGVDVMNILAIVIILISGVSVFISLLNVLKERKYELAIMRSVGAKRYQIFTLIILEAFVLTLVGTFFGLLLAHGGIAILGSFIEDLGISGIFFAEDEWKVLVLSLCVGFISGIIPATMAYRTDISKTLAKG